MFGSLPGASSGRWFFGPPLPTAPLKHELKRSPGRVLLAGGRTAEVHGAIHGLYLSCQQGRQNPGPPLPPLAGAAVPFTLPGAKKATTRMNPPLPVDSSRRVLTVCTS